MKRKNKPVHQVEFKKNSESVILKTFGENLKKIREQKGYSQEALAFVAGISRSYYAEIENGRRNVSLINMTKIISSLEIEFNKLLTLSEIEKNFK